MSVDPPDGDGRLPRRPRRALDVPVRPGANGAGAARAARDDRHLNHPYVPRVFTLSPEDCASTPSTTATGTRDAPRWRSCARTCARSSARCDPTGTRPRHELVLARARRERREGADAAAGVRTLAGRAGGVARRVARRRSRCGRAPRRRAHRRPGRRAAACRSYAHRRACSSRSTTSPSSRRAATCSPARPRAVSRLLPTRRTSRARSRVARAGRARASATTRSHVSSPRASCASARACSDRCQRRPARSSSATARRSRGRWTASRNARAALPTKQASHPCPTPLEVHMPVPPPALARAVAAARPRLSCCSRRVRPERDGARAAAPSTPRPTTPPATRCSGSSAPPTARSPPPARSPPAAPAWPTLGGRQGAVELSGDGRYLYAVNAGSDTVSVFRIGRRGTGAARLACRRAASRRTSVDEDRGRVYVLNSGGTPNVAAFWRRFDGSLKPIPGGTRDARARRRRRRAGLGHARTGARWSSPSALANRLETLPLDLPRAARARRSSRPSSGTVPFGFGDQPARGRSSSPRPAPAPSPPTATGAAARCAPITASLPVGQGAACWVAVSPVRALRLHRQRGRAASAASRSAATGR